MSGNPLRLAFIRSYSYLSAALPDLAEPAGPQYPCTVLPPSKYSKYAYSPPRTVLAVVPGIDNPNTTCVITYSRDAAGPDPSPSRIPRAFGSNDRIAETGIAEDR